MQSLTRVNRKFFQTFMSPRISIAQEVPYGTVPYPLFTDPVNDFSSFSCFCLECDRYGSGL